MFLYKLFFALIFSILSELVNADSEVFELILEAPNTNIENHTLYINDHDDRLYIGQFDTPKEPILGKITEVGYLEFAGESNNEEVFNAVAIGKNYLYPSNNVTNYASPFSIENGYLQLYSHDFHAVPSGMDNIYVIGSINAAAGRKEVLTIKIKAILKTDLNNNQENGNEDTVKNQTVIDNYHPASYTGASLSISINTVPFHHHHGNHGNKNNANPLDLNINNVAFYLLNSLF